MEIKLETGLKTAIETLVKIKNRIEEASMSEVEAKEKLTDVVGSFYCLLLGKDPEDELNTETLYL